jgi:hypothetical protein
LSDQRAEGLEDLNLDDLGQESERKWRTVVNHFHICVLKKPEKPVRSFI